MYVLVDWLVNRIVYTYTYIYTILSSRVGGRGRSVDAPGELRRKCMHAKHMHFLPVHARSTTCWWPMGPLQRSGNAVRVPGLNIQNTILTTGLVCWNTRMTSCIGEGHSGCPPRTTPHARDMTDGNSGGTPCYGRRKSQCDYLSGRAACTNQHPTTHPLLR